MFTLANYVGVHADSPDWNDARKSNANRLICACTNLQTMMEDAGIVFHLNPATNTTISGQTFGGFRPQDCPIGAAYSAHKTGEAVDRYDHDGAIDAWLVAHPEALVECGIYIEASASTIGWSHWSIRAPHSGNHIFQP
jgi:hypothetical protein